MHRGGCFGNSILAYGLGEPLTVYMTKTILKKGDEKGWIGTYPAI